MNYKLIDLSKALMRKKFLATMNEADGTSSNGMGARLNKARAVKNDEFYTTYEDAEKLLRPFVNDLRGKKVLMNVDSPNRSELFLWMYENMFDLNLAGLRAIGYGDDKMLELFPNGDSRDIPVTNNGDFMTGESLDSLRSWCDVVVGNPPFSKDMGPTFFQLAVDNGKDVIGIETPEKLMYGKLRDLLMADKIETYDCPYKTFNVPIDSATGEDVFVTSVNAQTQYRKAAVNVVVITTFKNHPELKLKLAPLFAEAFNLGMRHEDLPDSPNHSDKHTDVKVLVQANGTYSTLTAIPPKPKSNGISRRLIAMSPLKIFTYNWKRYFRLVGMVNVRGPLVDPHNGATIRPMMNATLAVFEYR